MQGLICEIQNKMSSVVMNWPLPVVCNTLCGHSVGCSDKMKFLCCSDKDSQCHHVHYRCLHGRYTDIYKQAIEKNGSLTGSETLYFLQSDLKIESFSYL